MARKPILFQPKLVTPQGINNYSGELFRCFTVGDTLPFKFTFDADDGSDLDVTGWTVTVAFSKDLGTINEAEFVIPLVDVVERVFEGNVTSTGTKTLTPGVNYAMAKYTDASDEDYIMDMCVLEIYQSL